MPYHLLILSAVIFISSPAIAQDSTGSGQAEAAAEADVERVIEQTTSASDEANGEDGSEEAQKMELSREIHRIRPVKEQIDRAISNVSRRVPEGQRDGFSASLRRMMNYRALQNYSIQAMAETFTVGELEAMLEYYSTPEAQSASEKMSEYQDKLSPEIVKMMDTALMQMRTGRSGN